MAEPFSDRDNPAKRRCPNDRESDTLFMSRSPEPNTLESIEEMLHDGEDDECGSEPDEPIYEESQEPFPAYPAFDPAMDDVRARVEMSVKKLDKLLESYASVNKDLGNMKAKSAEVLKTKAPRRIRVGLLGGTAAGKSALINSLTDNPDLAKELSAGEACTSVPMLYGHKLPRQTTPFAAKVSYQPLKDCQMWFKWLIGTYNRFTFNFDPDWTDEEKNKYRQEANTALATLRTLFCDKRQFESHDLTVKTLARTFQTGTRPNLLGNMASWYAERLRGKSQEDDMSYTSCQGDTIAELRAALDPLITPKYDLDAPSLWPLVKEVFVGVPSSRVLQDLVMVDLPGITDTNKIRVMSTLEHIRKCQALWYIAPVEHVCTDPDLEYAVSNYADRFPGKLAVIVTKVDRDATNALAKDMQQKKGQSIGDFEKHKDSIEHHIECLKGVRSRPKRKSCTASQRNILRDQEEALMDSIEKLQSKKLECVVHARNTHVVGRLKREKAQYLSEGTGLPVFCVSNRHYAVHKGAAPREGPLLEVKSTGIPDLRAYAMALVAPAVWENHKELFVHKLNILFHGVHGWAQNSPTKRNRGLPDVVTPVKNLWESIHDASVDRCIKDFSSIIVGKLRAGHASSMVDVMRYLKVIKEGWLPVTFLAFFRNNGNHSTKAVGAHSWNEDFIRWQKVNILNPAWDASPNPEDSFDAGVDKLITALEDIPEQLDSLPESVPLSTAAFTNMLQGQIALIRAERDRLRNDYRDKYGNIKLDACLDQYTGYFAKAMGPCYHAGKHDKGEGVCARVRNLLTNHITKEDPLGKATDKLELALKEAAMGQADCLRTEVKKILEEIHQQFELILRRESETAQETEARSKIDEALCELMPDVERIEFDLNAIEIKYMGALVQQ